MHKHKTPKVFVFGSNEAGIHGSGAARAALHEHGARFGCGFGYCCETTVNGADLKTHRDRFGYQITRHSFAVPTKDYAIQSLPLERVAEYVGMLLDFTTVRQDLDFQITQLGCGLAGFTPEQIAPMFGGVGLDNLYFDEAWKVYLPEGVKFWGTK